MPALPQDAPPDILVVGTGPGGAVAAAELARLLPAARILVLERGADHTRYPETLSAAKLLHAQACRHLLEEEWSLPQPLLLGRRLLLKMGHVAGGSHPFIGGTYVRGDAAGFRDWPQGFRWADLQPWFERVEAALPLRRYPEDELTRRLEEAGGAAGFSVRQDFNQGSTLGIGRPLSQFQHEAPGGPRITAYRHLLKTAEAECSNLKVRLEKSVQRILFHGRRAVGVALSDGQTIRLAPAGELILSCGAIGTPRLLLRSGIGPADELRRQRIAEVAIVEAVGRHLNDQYGFPLLFRSAVPIRATALPKTNMFLPLTPASDLAELQWYLQGLDGTVRSLFVFTYFRPRWLLRASQAAFAALAHAAQLRRLVMRRLVLAMPTNGRTAYDGRVTLGGIDCNFGADEQIRPLIEAIRLTRRLMSARPLQDAFALRELGTARLKTDAELMAFVRRKAASVWHYSSTCRIAQSPDAGAVDPRFRLFGVEGVRIVDASALPTCTTSGPTAVIMALAWKAAHLIAKERSGPKPLFDGAKTAEWDAAQ